MAEANMTQDVVHHVGHTQTTWVGQRHNPVATFAGYLGLALVVILVGVGLIALARERKTG